jgi:hypothetical protein
MSMEDGFNPDHPLPPFLAHRPEQRGIQKASERTVTSSRVFKASILIAAATATGIVALPVGDPVTLFAAVTASLGNSGLQPGADQPVSTIQANAHAPALIQSTADAEALPPTAKDAPLRDEIAASDPGKDQAEQSEPSSEKGEASSEILFRQFQAWVTEQDAQAKVRPVQPIQDAPAQVAQNAPAQVAENASVPHRLVQEHRHILPVHAARAEHRRKVRRAQSARVERPPTQSAGVERPPIQDARAQSQAAQNSQAPSFLQIFGMRN